MPSIANVIRRFTKQTLVYWAKAGPGDFGIQVYEEPVEVPCRWEDKKKEIVTGNGRKVLSQGYLLLAQPLVEGSLVFKGTLANWKKLPTYPTVPTVTEGGREVILVKETPDIKAQGYVYEVYL